MTRVKFFALILLLTTACGGVSGSEIRQAANDGRAIAQRMRPDMSPEEKKLIARDLVDHAIGYKDLFNGASAPQKAEILRHRVKEMEDAAEILSSAANDYKRAGKIDKARDVYWAILKSFTGDAYSSIRRNAEAELGHLTELQQRRMRSPEPPRD